MADLLLTLDDFWRLTQPIIRLYRSGAGRNPDYSGLTFWAHQVHTGLPVREVATRLAHAEPGLAWLHAGSDAEFIDAIYMRLLGRPADDAGKSHWRHVLASSDRGAVFADLMQGEEYGRRVGWEEFIIAAYAGMLSRVPDANELAGWSERLLAGAGKADFIATLLADPGYLRRAA
jgi:hypothetical protein